MENWSKSVWENWPKNQTNSNRMICNVETASLSKEHFCLLFRQIYWDNYQRIIKGTLKLLVYLTVFGTKRSQVTLLNNPASAFNALARRSLSILVAKANLSKKNPKVL